MYLYIYKYRFYFQKLHHASHFLFCFTEAHNISRTGNSAVSVTTVWDSVVLQMFLLITFNSQRSWLTASSKWWITDKPPRLLLCSSASTFKLTINHTVLLTFSTNALSSLSGNNQSTFVNHTTTFANSNGKHIFFLFLSTCFASLTKLRIQNDEVSWVK